MNDTSGWLADFLASREATCAATTCATYLAYVRDFERWITATSPDDPFSPATIRAYLFALRERGVGTTSQRNRYRVLKTLCRWLVEEEYLDRDPFSGRGRVLPPAHKRQRRRTYRREEVLALLRATFRPAWKRTRRKTIRIQWYQDGPMAREAIQAQALVLLLVDSAMRAGEVCALNCGQVRDAELFIRSKGGHRDVAFITAHTRTALLQVAGDRDDAEPLFRGWRGKRARPRTLRRLLRRMAERANVDLPPRPLHAFRHYAARQWLKAGLDDLTIRQLMRHENIATTQLYTELEPEELAAIHRKVSPIESLLADV